MAAAASWGFPFSKAARRRARLIARGSSWIRPAARTSGRRGCSPRRLGVSSADLVAAALVNEALRDRRSPVPRAGRPAAFADALASLEAARRAARRWNPTLDADLSEATPPRIRVPASARTRRAARVALEEMLHLWLADANPAFGPLRRPLRPEGAGRHPVRRHRGRAGRVLRGAAGLRPRQRGSRHPAAQPRGRLPQFVERPARVHPSQVRRDARRPAARAADGLDLLREQERLGAGAGPRRRGSSDVRRRPGESSRHSAPIRDWMPRVVMIAKNALVWLDQLSPRVRPGHRAARPGARRGAGPLARRGFTALWLIGVWERSPASRTHQAPDGEPRGRGLRLLAVRLRRGRRAGRRGGARRPAGPGLARGASAWPATWFPTTRASTPAGSSSTPSASSPGPRRIRPSLATPSTARTSPAIRGSASSSRTTTGTRPTRRSSSSGWTRATGETRYIYHGNDGTHMPWNDTAQLDFLKPEVTRGGDPDRSSTWRALFPIIRFDAAMTLTKQALPAPLVPRAGLGRRHTLARGQRAAQRASSTRRMPAEFWREVVDRVAARGAGHAAPGRSLLDARGLLRPHPGHAPGLQQRLHEHAEDGGQRGLPADASSNTLEFDPEVLKRFVNFMSNPDEQTAVAQFGTGDKYFGVAPMMATLPGLPMFAPRPDRGVPREVRHGVHAGPTGRGARPGARGAPRAGNLPAAQAPEPLRRVARFRLYDLYAPTAA